MRSQPKVPGVTRIPTGSSLIPKLRAKIEAEARANGVSKSWVVASILADHFFMQSTSYQLEVGKRMTATRARRAFKLVKQA